MEKFFVSRPIFAIVLSIVIVLLGVISISNLAIEQYPDITPPVVEVSATYQGADAQTVNNAVATPIAQSIMGVSDMLYMQSTSANDGTMSLQVTFDIGSNPDMNEVFTQNNVSTSTALLPSSVVTQGVVTRKAETGFVLVYALYSDGRYDGKYLSNYAYINIQNNLLKINGVGKVEIMGAGKYSMRVWIRPDVLNYYNISLSEIESAISTQSGIYPAGQLGAEPTSDKTVFTYTVTMPPQINTVEEYGKIVVKTLADGSQLLLEDIAEIDLGSQTYGTKAEYGMQPNAMIVVYQSPGSNAMKVGQAVRQTMSQLSERFPDGVEASVVVDATTSITAGIKEMIWTLLLALVLVILIIYLFIQDWRATLIPLIAIPVSLIGAFMLFPLLGFSINIISLLGLILAIVLVVDDAIIVVEAVQVNIAKGMDSKSATIAAMKNVSSPIIATTIVLLAVFIPVSFTGGITGLMFQQFSVTIAFSVVISSFNALTLSPALCSMLLKKQPEKTKGFFGAFNRVFDRSMSKYQSKVGIAIGHAKRMALFVCVALVAIGVMWKFLPKGFLPEEDQGYLMVMVNLPDAAALTRTQAVIDEADRLIKLHPQVKHTASAAGFNMLAGISSPQSGIIFVTLVDYNKRSLTAQQIASKLNEELYFAINDATAYAFTPPSIPGLGMTSGVTVEVQDLEGRGLEYLSKYAYMLIDTLEHTPKIASVITQFNAGVPQRRLNINRDYALLQGVSLSELYAQLSTFLGGTYINNFNRFGKLYNSYIQAAPEYRQDKSALNSYFISNSNSESVPLASFVDIVDTVGVEYISQFNLHNSIGLTVTPQKGCSSSQAMDIIEAHGSQILPTDIGLAWSGVSYQERNNKSGTAVYALALIFVFLALAALYNSWTLPITIMLGVPFAVCGAMLFMFGAHIFNTDYINDIFLQISLVMLIGLSAKNAILVVEYADNIFFGGDMSLFDAAVAAAKLRVRPILMTASSFILGVLPLVFASGAYSVARNTMGVALVGGMTFAMVIGIFAYPALYYLVGRLSGLEKKREKQRATKSLY